MEQDLSTPIVGRPHSTLRAAEAVVGLLFLALGAYAVVTAKWGAAALFLPVAAYALTDLRRKVTVTAERLVAQGRFARREVALKDLTRVALSPAVNIWVATTAGPGFYLRMVAPFKDVRNSGVRQFHGQLWARAVAAGAELTGDPDALEPAAPGTSPLFSA